MQNALIVLLILTVLPIACAWIAGYYRQRQLGSIDNKEPRQQAALLTGAGARAVAAQQNSWEALAIYSAALLAVVIAGVPLQSIATLALVVAALRVLYIGFYVANIDMLRSLAFLGSFGICLYFFYLAICAV